MADPALSVLASMATSAAATPTAATPMAATPTSAASSAAAGSPSDAIRPPFMTAAAAAAADTDADAAAADTDADAAISREASPGPTPDASAAASPHGADRLHALAVATDPAAAYPLHPALHSASSIVVPTHAAPWSDHPTTASSPVTAPAPPQIATSSAAAAPRADAAAAAPVHARAVYSAVYSGTPVYEMMVKNVAVMRRQADAYINATQILRAAGLAKPQRTKILERDVAQGVHDKVQGGYAGFQGTWIPLGDARLLAAHHRLDHLLVPLFDLDVANYVNPGRPGGGSTPAKARHAGDAAGSSPGTPRVPRRRIPSGNGVATPGQRGRVKGSTAAAATAAAAAVASAAAAATTSPHPPHPAAALADTGSDMSEDANVDIENDDVDTDDARASSVGGSRRPHRVTLRLRAKRHRLEAGSGEPGSDPARWGLPAGSVGSHSPDVDRRGLAGSTAGLPDVGFTNHPPKSLYPYMADDEDEADFESDDDVYLPRVIADLDAVFGGSSGGIGRFKRPRPVGGTPSRDASASPAPRGGSASASATAGGLAALAIASASASASDGGGLPVTHSPRRCAACGMSPMPPWRPGTSAHRLLCPNCVAQFHPGVPNAASASIAASSAAPRERQIYPSPHGAAMLDPATLDGAQMLSSVGVGQGGADSPPPVAVSSPSSAAAAAAASRPPSHVPPSDYLLPSPQIDALSGTPVLTPELTPPSAGGLKGTVSSARTRGAMAGTDAGPREDADGFAVPPPTSLLTRSYSPPRGAHGGAGAFSATAFSSPPLGLDATVAGHGAALPTASAVAAASLRRHRPQTGPWAHRAPPPSVDAAEDALAWSPVIRPGAGLSVSVSDGSAAAADLPDSVAWMDPRVPLEERDQRAIIGDFLVAVGRAHRHADYILQQQAWQERVRQQHLDKQMAAAASSSSPAGGRPRSTTAAAAAATGAGTPTTSTAGHAKGTVGPHRESGGAQSRSHPTPQRGRPGVSLGASPSAAPSPASTAASHRADGSPALAARRKLQTSS